MNLSHSQKKYLKKNLNKLPLERIATDLKLTSQDILNFAKKNWPREKYQKVIEQDRLISQAKDSLPVKNNFNFKSFFFKNWKIFLFLTILVLGVYFNSLNNAFLSDDIAAIKENPLINQVGYFWKPPYFDVSPRAITIFSVNKFFGLNPLFFRLPNILLHLGSTWLVYLIVASIINPPIAFMTASFFAVHPILIESVTWISGGPYVFGAFFILLSFYFYLLSNKKRILFFFAVAVFYLALSSLLKNITFPLILLLYEFSLGNLKTRWRKIIPFLFLGVVGVFYLFGLLGERITSLEKTYYQTPGIENPLIQIPIAISSYLKLIFWPDNLTLYHSELSFTQGQYSLMLVITLAFLALIVWGYKKNRQIFFWSSFFIIALLPTLTPLRVGWVVAERYVYFGSLGIFVFIAWLITKMGALIKNQKISWFIFALIILALSTRTIIRNFDWKNQDTLWVATAKTSPSSHQNHNNLGDLYARRGEYEKAVAEFKKAIELKPNYGDAYHNLGNVYHQMGKDDLAEENYQKALSFNSNLWQSYQNIAAIYFNQNKFDLALENLQKAVKINPQNEELYLNLGIIYLKTGNNQKAKEAFQKTLTLNPKNEKAQQLLSSIK